MLIEDDIKVAWNTDTGCTSFWPTCSCCVNVTVEMQCFSVEIDFNNKATIKLLEQKNQQQNPYKIHSLLEKNNKKYKVSAIKSVGTDDKKFP